MIIEDMDEFIAANQSAKLEDNQLKVLSTRIKTAIDDWAVQEFQEDFRTRLGASIIHRECDRFLYLSFRWVFKDIRDGRMHRLLQRGKEEEARFIKMLRAIGFTFWEVDPATGKQFRFQSAHGHFGGSMDGFMMFPESWGIPGIFLPEFKTNQTGSGFNKLGSEGLAKAKPDHFVQQSLYGRGKGIRYGVYLNVNKNDDDIYCEVYELDFGLAERYEQRADNIITTDYVPAKPYKETDYRCKTCPAFKVCHKNQPAEKNCRSCVHSKPAMHGRWNCNKFQDVIPVEFVPNGCDGWTPLV